MFILSLSYWDYDSVSPNRKLNFITWRICFSLNKSRSTTRNNTCFHRDSAHSKVTKVILFMQNGPHIFLYRAYECKYFHIPTCKWVNTFWHFIYLHTLYLNHDNDNILMRRPLKRHRMASPMNVHNNGSGALIYSYIYREPFGNSMSACILK